MEYKFEGRFVSPFVCSTTEFVDEQIFLRENIYPRLAKLYSQRGVSFQPAQWDMNLTDDQLNRGQALQLAFESIQRAAPFFIGLIGDHYGIHRDPESPPLPKLLAGLDKVPSWIDKNFLIAAESGFDWILQELYQTTSLLELKITQAAFLSEDTEFCHFYIREHSTEKKENLQSETSQTSYEVFKIRELKASIAKRGLSIKYFKTFEELGEAVFADWKGILDNLFPAFNTNQIRLPNHIETSHHQAFCAKRRQCYVKTSANEKCSEQLTKFASQTADYDYNPLNRAQVFAKATGIRLLKKERDHQTVKRYKSNHKSVCVITGSRGCGKSALLSNWLEQEAKFSLPDDMKVIYHSSAKCTMSRNIAVFMKRCITELRHHFCKDFDDRYTYDEPYESFAQIRETFLSACSLGQCLLIFDGLDEMAATMGMSIVELKQMEWLADPLPPCCKIIFTVTTSDYSVKSLEQRSDAIFLSHPDLCDKQDRKALLDELLFDADITLSNAHVEQIVSYKLSSCPVYLRMLVHELRDFHVMRELDSHINIYANVDNMNTTFRNLWTFLLKRWVRDYSWTRYSDDAISKSTGTAELSDIKISGWVPDAMRLIACSRNGLRVKEILGTLEYGMGYMGENAISVFDWEVFYTAARSAFYEKPDGLLVLAHEHFTEVIDFLLLGNVAPPAVHETNAEFQGMQKMGGMERRQYHISLASHLMSMPAEEQLWRIDEIFWQLEISGDFIRLCSILVLPQVFLSLHNVEGYQSMRTELFRFWRLLASKKIDVNQKIFKQLAEHGIRNLVEQTLSLICASEGQEVLSDYDYELTNYSDNFSEVRKTPRSQKEAWKITSHSMRSAISDVSLNSAAESSENVTMPTLTTETRRSPGVREYGSDSPFTLQSFKVKSDGEVDARSPPKIVMTRVGTRSTTPMIAPVPIRLNTIRMESSVYSSKISDADMPEYFSMTSSGDVMPERPSSAMMLSQLPNTPVNTIQLSIAASELLTSCGDYECAEKILKSTINWMVHRYPLSTEELLLLCQLYGRVAKCESVKRNYQLAEASLEKARMSLLDSFTDAKSESRLRQFIRGKLLIDLGEVKIQLGDIESAEDILTEARIDMQALKHRVGESRVVYQQGVLRSKRGLFAKATECLETCQEFFEGWYGCMSPLVAEIAHKLGVMLYGDDNYESRDPVEAQECLWKALHIRRKLDEDSLDTADTLYELGFHMQKDGIKTRKREAVELLENCLDIRTRKLGNNHQETKTIMYLLNDLEISLQLGQFMFGEARPSDNRSRNRPFSALTMHEHQLAEYHDRKAKERHPGAPTNNTSLLPNRPKSAYNIAKPRSESRLQRTMISRPKTAPSRMRAERLQSAMADRQSRPQTQQGLVFDDSYSDLDSRPVTSEPQFAHSATSSRVPTPEQLKEYNSYEAQLENVGKNKQILTKYAQRSNTANRRPTSGKTSQLKSKATHHKCAVPGPHTIHEKLNTVSLGPYCNVKSVAGPPPCPRPVSSQIHRSAWYHVPNHYSTADKPQVSMKIFAQRKCLMRQRSNSAPLKSQYLNDHNDAIGLLAQQKCNYLYDQASIVE